jgi:hypothetical protein
LLDLVELLELIHPTMVPALSGDLKLGDALFEKRKRR